MKYPVTYDPNGWRQLTPPYPSVQAHNDVGAIQIVHRDLNAHARLSVELLQRTDGSVEVAVARLEVGRIDGELAHYRTSVFLRPSDVELVAVASAAASEC